MAATSQFQVRQKARLAIVSTYDDLCGIAGYTRRLVKQLEPYFDIEVFDLDQFFMRSTAPKVVKHADALVNDFCQRCREFDFVNVQLEHGTFGRRRGDIVRRFRMIAEAAPALSVTYHSMLVRESFQWNGLTRLIKGSHLVSASLMVGNYWGRRLLGGAVNQLLLRLQAKKPVNIIVHTRRDLRIMKYVYGFKNVFDHPLAFLDASAVQEVQASARRADISGLANIPEGSKVIGLFGFLSEYKGFDTAIRALRQLPGDYHLALFGGVHPNEIQKHQPINPYVRILLDETYADVSAVEGLGSNVSVTVQGSDEIAKLFEHPRSVGSRIHFLGAQTDEDFARGVAACDIVVMPYLEVGQSSSGPLSIAVEMGARVIASRTHAFMQFARYYPDRLEFFDIGNHLELAEKILAPRPPLLAESKYNAETNAAIYVAANVKPTITT